MGKPSLPTLALLIVSATATGAVPATTQEPNFGRAVAMTVDELIVGQPVNWYGPGTVYSYGAAGESSWTERQRLTAPDSSRMDDFGRAVAVDGNTLVVGAPRKRDGSGAVYVFTRGTSAAPWQIQATLESSAPGEEGQFGFAAVLSGDDLLVGAPAASPGAVHHFRRSGNDWTLQGTIRPPTGPGVEDFGAALALRDDLLLIGAPGSGSGAGHVYTVERRVGGAWGEARRVDLPASVASEGAGAGTTLTASEDQLFVGAPGAASVAVLEAGATGGWSTVHTIASPVAANGTRFGFAMALVGDELWVGAPGIERRNGRVFRYSASADGRWGDPVRLDPDDTSGASWPLGFGYAIASAGGRAVVSMPSRDFGEGRVMALARSAGGWSPGDILEGHIYRIGAGLEQGDRCAEGRMTEFPCTNMELVAHMPIGDLGGERGVWVNDVWGWTDPETGRDYALVARRDGASFVDLTDPSAPRLVGNLPRTVGSPPSVWRDIKVIDQYAYIVSDGAGAHGMQVFDLARLRSVGDEAVDFEPDTTYREIFSAHNVVADTASKFLYIVAANGGGRTCGGGLHMVDARDPLQPRFAGCYHDTASPGARGYTHDAQCLVYEVPDERYHGRQICVGSNESEINIADVTDKSNPVTVARMSYPNVAYAHQGWFDEEQRYFYMNDEIDELAGNVSGTRTIVWDLTELDDPVVANEYIGPVRASDHNLYVVGDRMYQSNYGSGLRVLDISDRANPHEIAFFDSAPYNENEPGHSAGQSGAWSNYPFFESGVVIFTSVREGLFIMRVRPPPVS
jgi:choice-of-anchor B domain-containing protein